MYLCGAGALRPGVVRLVLVELGSASAERADFRLGLLLRGFE